MKLLARLHRWLDPSIEAKDQFERSSRFADNALTNLRSSLASCEAEVAQSVPPPPRYPVIYAGAVVAYAWKLNFPNAQFRLWSRPEGHA